MIILCKKQPVYIIQKLPAGILCWFFLLSISISIEFYLLPFLHTQTHAHVHSCMHKKLFHALHGAHVYRKMDIQLICDQNREADDYEFVFDKETTLHYVSNVFHLKPCFAFEHQILLEVSYFAVCISLFACVSANMCGSMSMCVCAHVL